MFQTFHRRLAWLAGGLGVLALLPLTGVLHAQPPDPRFRTTSSLAATPTTSAPGAGGISGGGGGCMGGNQLPSGVRRFPQVGSYLGAPGVGFQGGQYLGGQFQLMGGQVQGFQGFGGQVQGFQGFGSAGGVN